MEVEGCRVCEAWICRHWALRQVVAELKGRLQQTVFDGLTFAAVLFCAGIVAGLMLHHLLSLS